MKKQVGIFAMIGTIVLALGLVWYYIMPHTPVGVPQVVARSADSGPCGDLLLMQTFTGTTEPYVVSLYRRRTQAGPWEEYYLDHEAPYWRGEIRAGADKKHYVITYYGDEIATFGCHSGRLVLTDGRVLPAKAHVQDPFAESPAERAGPMDVGAASNAIRNKRGSR